jgi:hypothetical protein
MLIQVWLQDNLLSKIPVSFQEQPMPEILGLILQYNDSGGTVNNFYFINSTTGYLCGGSKSKNSQTQLMQD